MIESSFDNFSVCTKSVIHILRVCFVSNDYERKLLVCETTEEPKKTLFVKYGEAPENYAFNPTIKQLCEGDLLNLLHCEVDNKGYVTPSYIVLEPDYLIDASAVAACFQNYAITPLHYFRNKFEEVENRSYLLLGNLANFFLDELVYADDPAKVNFNDAFLRSYKHAPFEYASCQDILSATNFRDFMEKARQQFENIGRVIQDDFPKFGIDTHQSILEPSFFSAMYGFQGRLDLWHPACGDHKSAIVELKSGRLPFPEYDREKIALNHEVQTAVYRLMIESVFDERGATDAAILYSAGNRPGENLRIAEKDEKLDKAIVNLRNLIVANEKRMVIGDNNEVALLFTELFESVKEGGRLPSFYTHKIARMQERLNSCSALEKSYFYRFTRFISRELYHQKIGDIQREIPTGVASLWNSTFWERAEALDILYDLTILEIQDEGNELNVRFSRPENGLVNFREGDICIVYPRESEKDTVLNQQILKGSVVIIRPDEITVRFRYKQKNRRYFDENRLWAIEHDALDSSYTSMYKGLFSFLAAPQQKKNLLLGMEAPQDSPQPTKFTHLPYPDNIIDQARQAEDYFLIVGPPGTGKTSIFARRLIESYYNEPGTNILVLAYTNRAVDELCEAIHAGLGDVNGTCDAYIRVGSELSCAEPYRSRLLQNIASKAPDRQSLLHEIARTRVVVSTLASINGRMELFSLKHFHVAIIDEASQILEPQIIGLLPRFDRFVMIGDHHQLSTIVLQDREHTQIDEPDLQSAGFADCHESLFERLIRRCLKKGWNHAHVQLTRQGRMHQEIANFPGFYFYPEGLTIANDWQSGPWHMTTQTDRPINQLIAGGRTAFITTENGIFHEDEGLKTQSTKINETEAEVVAQLIAALFEVYDENGKKLTPNSIGIIAPYRNQIAVIRRELQHRRIVGADEIMVETVERFQGSQRETIVLSFCVNEPGQLDFLCNLNREGTVDRKLNVAMTRARQQLFLVGNARILRKHPIYKQLIDHYKDKMVHANSLE